MILNFNFFIIILLKYNIDSVAKNDNWKLILYIVYGLFIINTLAINDNVVIPSLFLNKNTAIYSDNCAIDRLFNKKR